jgi:hypothetical protein
MIRRTVIALILSIGCPATHGQADWRIEFESKTVIPNQAAVSVGVTGCWEVPLQRFLIPIIVRPLDTGSFWTGELPYDSGAVQRGVSWNWKSPWADVQEAVWPVVPVTPYATDGDIGYDGLPPDHFAILAEGGGVTTSAEPTGRVFVTLTFAVNDNPGQFEFDTACLADDLDALSLIDGEFPPLDHGPRSTGACTFNKGVITIGGGPPEFDLCMDTASVPPGHHAVITLSKVGAAVIGGLDLVISYDPTLAFLNAIPVGDLAAWEYFTSRQSAPDNRGSGLTGILRLTGIANMPDGVTPDESVYSPAGPLVELTFAAPDSDDFIGDCFHLRWTWFDCGDNAASSVMGDTLLVARGILNVLPDSACLDGHKGTTPLPNLGFSDGRICIVLP